MKDLAVAAYTLCLCSYLPMTELGTGWVAAMLEKPNGAHLSPWSPSETGGVFQHPVTGAPSLAPSREGSSTTLPLLFLLTGM